MISWSEIDSVFLDMDGTLLDLHFDNHFWRQYVPEKFARLHGLTVEDAKEQLYPRFQSVEGTMDWYCVDFWSRELDLDIPLLKSEIDHLIAVHPGVPEFLADVRASGRRIALVTNAHQKSLALKMERTQLRGAFDAVICSHDFGIPKEQNAFWDQLQMVEPFDATRTLLVDDSLPVLRSARDWGLAHLLAVRFPDSRGEERMVEEFPAISAFDDLLPVA